MLIDLSLVVSLAAFAVSYFAWRESRRVRSADSFAKLYDEFNSVSFGRNMESLGNWLDGTALELGKIARDLSSEETRAAYRSHLERLRGSTTKADGVGSNTKNDEVEQARRTVKAWFIKCLHYHEAHDITETHVRALITPSRWSLMLRVIDMTREQDAFWKGPSYDGQCSDDAYFERLERLVGGG
jgi:hypothetical protein